MTLTAGTDRIHDPVVLLCFLILFPGRMGLDRHGMFRKRDFASFDRRFLDAECCRISRDYKGEFACSMLVARRVYPDAPNHKLGTLVEFKCLPSDGTFHRALADAEMTTHLWLGMLNDISSRFSLETISFSLMQALSRIPKAAVPGFPGRQEG